MTICRDEAIRRSTRCSKIEFDDRIPFWPQWIRIYNLLYYVMIGLTAVSIGSLRGGHLIFGGRALLVSGTVIFYFFPTEAPASFRDFKVRGPATRYIRVVQSFDTSRNAFPSMHCAVAAYAGLILTDLPDSPTRRAETATVVRFQNPL